MGLFNKKKKSNSSNTSGSSSIDRLIQEMYAQNSTEQTTRETIGIFQEAGFTQQQTQSAFSYLTGNSPDSSDINIGNEQYRNLGLALMRQLEEPYSELKSNLEILLGDAWHSMGNTVTLSQLLRSDVEHYVTYLGVLGGSLKGEPVELVNIVCASDHQPTTDEALYQVAKTLGISSILNTNTLTPSLQQALTIHDRTPLHIVDILEHSSPISENLMIVALQTGVLFVSISNIMLTSDDWVARGIVNYLSTQLDHLSHIITNPHMRKDFDQACVPTIEKAKMLLTR